MGNIPFNRRLIRRLTKNSTGTLSVTIPIEHASALGWGKGRQVQIKRYGKKLVIEAVDKQSKKQGKK